MYNKVMKSFISGNTSIFLIAMVGIASGLAYFGLSANVFDGTPQADLRIEPNQIMTTIDKTFTVDVVVSSDIAVNVFAGDLSFNPSVLKIEKIDYNTSIADLWAERPWYHNGDGTMNFAGGTTKSGGFSGEGKLISITFKTISTGNGDITIEDARILIHDGLGTDAVLAEPIDTIVTIDGTSAQTQEVLNTSGPRTAFVVTKEPVKTDLNGDGKQSIADVSIFMGHLATQEMRSDFDKDGTVGLKDLSILMKAE